MTSNGWSAAFFAKPRDARDRLSAIRLPVIKQSRSDPLQQNAQFCQPSTWSRAKAAHTVTHTHTRTAHMNALAPCALLASHVTLPTYARARPPSFVAVRLNLNAGPVDETFQLLTDGRPPGPEQSPRTKMEPLAGCILPRNKATWRSLRVLSGETGAYRKAGIMIWQKYEACILSTPTE